MTQTQKIYVTMTDKFMSDWGMAKGKINKFVVECDSVLEAEFVYNKALNRPEMKYVNICYAKPYYNPNRYYVSWHTKQDGASWYPS